MPASPAQLRPSPLTQRPAPRPGRLWISVCSFSWREPRKLCRCQSPQNWISGCHSLPPEMLPEKKHVLSASRLRIVAKRRVTKRSPFLPQELTAE